MQTIAEVMTRSPIIVQENASLSEAARLMRDHGIGDVLVTRSDGALCGITTDRDIVVRAIADGCDPGQTPIRDVCTSDVVTLRPEDTADRAVELMRQHHVRRIAVTEGDQIVGVVSIGDMAMERDENSALSDISAADPNN